MGLKKCHRVYPTHIAGEAYKAEFCIAMTAMLEGTVANERKKGLSEVVVTNSKTFAQRVLGVVYRPRANHNGILLSCCPWCKADILWEKA